jgi:beta-glucosidase
VRKPCASLAVVVMAVLCGGLVPVSVASPGGSATPIYLNRAYSFHERAADLVSRMTLAEKASQMISSQAPAIPRLGVPAYGWWNEALHGVSRLQLNPSGNATVLHNTTSYPISLSLGASWDPSLMHREASAISDEAREVVPGNNLDLDFFSPTVNLGRDPRWGRNDETFSEDPLLTAQLASRFVDGMEGKDSQGRLLPAGGGYLKTTTTIKHFAMNNSEVNRRTGSSDTDQRTLREYYTAQFRKIIQDAQPGAVMSSYNRVNGVPAAANVQLMDTLARETFGFDGYFASDCDAIFEIVAGHHWTPPGYPRPLNNTERHAFAMTAGEDLNCNTGYHDAFNYLNSVPEAVGQQIPTQTDTFNENDVDVALTRLFTNRMRLGEFDDVANEPYVKAARGRVAPGSWTNSDANGAVTETPARLALAREAGAKSLVLLKNASGPRKDGSTAKVLPIHVPSTGPFKVAVMGYFANPQSLYLGGYSSVQGPPGVAKEVSPYEGLKRAIQAINPQAQVDFFPGFTGTGTTAASLTTVDPAAVDAASGYDDVIVYAGTDTTTANEDVDRATMALPGAQADLISQVGARNPNTVAVMETLGQVDVGSFQDSVPAMLWSSYNGQRKGEALADVVLGNQNPSGHLPFLWYRSAADLPPITDYAIRPSATSPGRTYMYFRGPVSFPFGYGLSYSDFEYSRLRTSAQHLDANDTLSVSVDVTNTGSVTGSANPELYVTTPDAPAAAQRPIKRLEGFRQVTLAPGETKTVTLTVKVPDLAFFDEAADRYRVDDGRYGIQISTSSADADVQQQAFVQVDGAMAAKPEVLSIKPTAQGDAARDIATRQIFPQDTAIAPHVTVALSDESLFGYITKGQSRPLPAGLTVRYATDRPSVVSASHGGTRLRTGHAGVATVTATASYRGGHASTAFVVRVVPQPSAITVDGRPLRGFRADRHDYEVTVGGPGNRAPRVGVRVPGAGAHVVVHQASGVPGAATVTVTSKDGISARYTVSFARAARSDDFAAGTLAPQWRWIRPDPAAESLSARPGALVITPQAGDLTNATNTARNILVQDAPGDWTIQSKLTFSSAPHVATQQGGLIAYQDDDDYLKLDWEFSGGVAKLSETNEDSLSGAPISQVLATVPTAAILGDDTTIWLRMVKRRARYRTSYSTNGTDFTPIYTTGAALTKVRVGLFAFNGAATNDDLTVAFDDFRVVN